MRLSDDDAVVLLRTIAQRAECGGWTGHDPLLDPWQRRVLVDLRKSERGRIELRLWSRGPDGQEGTGDDVSNAGFGLVK